LVLIFEGLLDASLQGWAAALGDNQQGEVEHLELLINILELLIATFLH
jgi:hypothetical protein